MQYGFFVVKHEKVCYYKKNENCFTGRTATDSLRMAGIGGVNVVKTIPVSWTFTLAGEQYTETNIPVVTSSEQNEEYDCRIGLPTLMAHRKFIINFKNMWIIMAKNMEKKF